MKKRKGRLPAFAVWLVILMVLIFAALGETLGLSLFVRQGEEKPDAYSCFMEGNHINGVRLLDELCVVSTNDFGVAYTANCAVVEGCLEANTNNARRMFRSAARQLGAVYDFRKADAAFGNVLERRIYGRIE